MDRGRPGRRYLLGGENLTLAGLLGILSELTGVPVPGWSVPYPIGLAVAYVSEWVADHVTGKTPKATVTGVRLTRRTMHFDASRSLAELGLRPRPVAESLADAVEWLRETGEIPAAMPYSRRVRYCGPSSIRGLDARKVRNSGPYQDTRPVES
jgi:dihydroflavonol-4-reductase